MSDAKKKKGGKFGKLLTDEQIQKLAARRKRSRSSQPWLCPDLQRRCPHETQTDWFVSSFSNRQWELQVKERHLGAMKQAHSTGDRVAPSIRMDDRCAPMGSLRRTRGSGHGQFAWLGLPLGVCPGSPPLPVTKVGFLRKKKKRKKKLP